MCAGPEIAAAMAAITDAAAVAAAPVAEATTAAAAVTPEMEAAMGGLDALQSSGLGGMSVAQQGIGAGSTSSQLAGLLNNPASALSANGLPAGLLGNAASGSAGSSGGKMLMGQMGLSMLQPKQAPQGHGAPPMQGQQGPLPNPYGTPAGNSLGVMTEEQKRKLRAMGVRI